MPEDPIKRVKKVNWKKILGKALTDKGLVSRIILLIKYIYMCVYVYIYTHTDIVKCQTTQFTIDRGGKLNNH